MGTKYIYLETGDVSAEEGSEFATAPLTLTFVAHLIVEYVWLDFDLKIKQKKIDKPD